MQEPCTMLHITLGADDLVAVAYERYHHPEPIVQRKMTVLWLKQQGLPIHEIARLAGVSRASVTRYLKEFSQGGLDAIRRFPWKGRRGQLDDRWVKPGRALPSASATLPSTSPADHRTTDRPAPRLSGSAFPAAAGAQAAARLLPYRYRPRARFPNTSGSSVAFWTTNSNRSFGEARAGLRDVYFVDASHFVFGSFLGYVWCFVRLCIRAASGRKRYNVLGALHAVSHQIDPGESNHSYINATSVCDLLLPPVAAASVGRRDLRWCWTMPATRNAPFSPGVGPILENPSAVPAFLIHEPEPDRAGVEVRQERMLAVRVQHASYEAFTAAIDNCLRLN